MLTARDNCTHPWRIRRGRELTLGKRADLVVIRGNPIERPTEIRNVTLVFKEGLGYDAPKLIESVKSRLGVQ